MNTRSRDIAWKALNTPELLTDGERKTAIDLFAEKHDLLVSEDKKIEKAREQLQKEGREASERLQTLCDLVYGKGRAKVDLTVTVDWDKPTFSCPCEWK